MMRDPAENITIGRKIERIRKVRGISQETLASILGMSRQAVSKLEQSESLEETKLEMVAKALGVTAEAIRSFNEDAVINNNIYDQNNTVINYQMNSLEKYQELFDENRKLYQQLIQAEREKVEILQKLFDKK